MGNIQNTSPARRIHSESDAGAAGRLPAALHGSARRPRDCRAASACVIHDEEQIPLSRSVFGPAGHVPLIRTIPPAGWAPSTHPLLVQGRSFHHWRTGAGRLPPAGRICSGEPGRERGESARRQGENSRVPLGRAFLQRPHKPEQCTFGRNVVGFRPAEARRDNRAHGRVRRSNRPQTGEQAHPCGNGRRPRMRVSQPPVARLCRTTRRTSLLSSHTSETHCLNCRFSFAADFPKFVSWFSRRHPLGR